MRENRDIQLINEEEWTEMPMFGEGFESWGVEGQKHPKQGDEEWGGDDDKEWGGDDDKEWGEDDDE